MNDLNMSSIEKRKRDSLEKAQLIGMYLKIRGQSTENFLLEGKMIAEGCGMLSLWKPENPTAKLHVRLLRILTLFVLLWIFLQA